MGRRIDAVTNGVRRLVERALPWFDPAEAAARRVETERVRQRSIAVRIRAEKAIAARYERADKALGR